MVFEVYAFNNGCIKKFFAKKRQASACLFLAILSCAFRVWFFYIRQAEEIVYAGVIIGGKLFMLTAFCSHSFLRGHQG